MNVPEQIRQFISTQPEPKRADIQALHELICIRFKNLTDINIPVLEEAIRYGVAASV